VSYQPGPLAPRDFINLRFIYWIIFNLNMDFKHFLKPDHLPIIISIVLLILNLYFNEKIITMIILLLILFVTIYDIYEEI